MCALRIVVPSNSYTGGFIRYSPVVTDGLKLWMFPGGMGFPPTKNHAPGGSDATILGSPIIQNGYAECTGGSDLFQTDVYDNADMTVIAVQRAHKDNFAGDAETPSSGGNLHYPTGSRSGFRLGWQRNPSETYADLTAYLGDGDNFSVVRPLPEDAVAPTNWGMSMFRINPTDGSEVRNLTAGVGRVSGTIKTFEPGTSPITVGGNPTILKGKCDVAFFAVYHRALSENEIQDIYAQVSGFLAARTNITV